MNFENLICFSPQQAAAKLGISRGLCYRLLAGGTLPAVRMGRRLVIPVAALEAMLTASREGGDTPWEEEPGELPTATERCTDAKTDASEQPSA